jgi:hypothetical protein
MEIREAPRAPAPTLIARLAVGAIVLVVLMAPFLFAGLGAA